MAEPNGYIEGSNGERIEIVDSAARESLKTKLPAPKTAKAGDYLRISAINEDGSMLVEAVSAPGVELPTEATFAHITLETAQTADGECGVIIHPEGTEDVPELTFYGMRGDEAVRLNNVADAVDDRSVPNLGQVKNLVQKNGNDSGQNLSLDTTLSQSGKAADAKATGDAIKKVEEKIPSIEGLAKTEEIPTKPEDIGAQPQGNYASPDDIPKVPNWAMQANKPGYTASEVGADPKGTAESKVSEHNADTAAHNDLRLEIKAIREQLAAFLDVDEETLNELSELIAAIAANQTSISQLTTGKVSVADIVNNLTTNVANKPLSAAQGVALKTLIDGVSANLANYQPKGNYALASDVPTKVSQLANDKGYLTEHQDISDKLDKSELPTAIDTALAQAKANGEFDGADGQRGLSLLSVTTAPASYTTAVGGITPKYRMAISTIKSQAGVSEVLLGDTVRYSYYQYPIAYLDASYAYFTERISIRGATGAAGKDATVTMYISPDGNDSNDGLTADTPKKTVSACVTAGASQISAKRGVYAEQVAISGVEHLEIYPTDNGQEYSTDADWPPIVFDLSDTLTPANLAAYNSIKRIAYTNSANEQFDKVFTKKSQNPVSDEYGKRYNATVWLMSNDEKTVCIKLKPVLTVAECEAEANTFAWVSGYIYINADMTGVEKICVPTNFDSGFRIADAGKVILREVEVRFSGSYNVWVLNCPYFDFYKVSARYSSYASGIDIDNANGRLNACYATKNFDGFGVSGYGHTTYVDCVSEFNFDDGASHHNGSCGTFIGGRYEGNGKGGNTPAYGAQVNIYGGIYKGNAQFGIGYLYTSGKNPAGGMVQGAVMVGNPVGLSVTQNCNVTAIGCIYEDNTADKNVTGNLTEYNHNYVKSVNGILPDENGNVTVEGGAGEEDTGPKNLLPLAINSDGTPYVGTNGEKGYKVGWRLSSSGAEKEQAGCVVTGFIPVKAGDVLRIKNFTANTAGYGYMFTYKADFTKFGDSMNGSVMADGIVDGVLTVDISEQFASSASSAAYVRFSASEITEDTIVTVNEEIPA